MKKIILFIIFLIISASFVFGQTNTFPASGNVGIGTLAPGEKLSVGYGLNGDIGIGSATGNKIFLSSFNNNAILSINRSGSAGIYANPLLATASVSLTSNNSDSYIRFCTNNVNNKDGIERVRIDKDGNVGIGTTSPGAKLDVNGNIYSDGKIFIGTPDANTATKIAPYSLAVNGTAIFTKAIVKLNSAWPDYVFHKEYRLPTLGEIEQFIQLNGHLPEVPKAEDVDKNGIDLGGNQVLLLKKIEELTLILIEQNKRIEKMEKEQWVKW